MRRDCPPASIKPSICSRAIMGGCVLGAASATDIAHLDLVASCQLTMVGMFAPNLGVVIVAPMPDGSKTVANPVVVGAPAQQRTQVVAGVSKQAQENAP